MDDLTQARGHTVGHLASELLKVAGEVLITHGEDPKSHAIVAAGFVAALRRSQEADPRILMIVKEMLRPGAPTEGEA